MMMLYIHKHVGHVTQIAWLYCVLVFGEEQHSMFDESSGAAEGEGEGWC